MILQVHSFALRPESLAAPGFDLGATIKQRASLTPARCWLAAEIEHASRHSATGWRQNGRRRDARRPPRAPPGGVACRRSNNSQRCRAQEPAREPRWSPAERHAGILNAPACCGRAAARGARAAARGAVPHPRVCHERAGAAHSGVLCLRLYGACALPPTERRREPQPQLPAQGSPPDAAPAEQSS